MNVFFFGKTPAYKKILFLALTCLLFSAFIFLSACTKRIEYFDYVSELRNNLFLAHTEDFSLKIYSVAKESPYAADGVAQPTSPRLEAYLIAPSGDKTTNVRLSLDGEEVGGEMSYDHVKGEYFYGHSVDASHLRSIDCTILFGEEEVSFTATSVLTENTLSPKAALETLYEERKQSFAALTDEYGFAGEIYLRLIYEDFPYYYVGIIDREGNVQAFLLNAETGAILAHREK